MNATRRISLVAFLAMIALGLLTGCSRSMPGSANPAAVTGSSTSASASPVAPDSGTPTRAQQESTTTPSANEPSTEGPISQEPTSQEPSTQEPGTQDSGPAVRATDLTGEVYGFIRDVDVTNSELALDKVDWFSGTDAEQACTADNVPDEARLDGWCSIYYFRNVNPTLRVVSVSPDVAVVSLQGTTPVSEDLQALADRVGSGREYHPYRITVTDGAIVELRQIYQP